MKKDNNSKENNSSRQIVLSILGILVLVFAVVGVSFAFFNYSKVGEENNVIQTGSVFFNFTETNTINLKNQFPMSDEKGKAIVASSDNGTGILNFSITGFDSSSKGIDYTIYAIKGDIPEGNKPQVSETGEVTDGTVPYSEETDRLKDTDIKLFLTVGDGGAAGLITNNFSDDDDDKIIDVIADHLTGEDKTLGDGIQEDGSIKGAIIATGHITGNGKYTKDKPLVDSYQLRMWISDDVQLVSDEASKAPAVTPAKNDASVFTTTEFGTKYYSIKILIDAKTGATKEVQP